MVVPPNLHRDATSGTLEPWLPTGTISAHCGVPSRTIYRRSGGIAVVIVRVVRCRHTGCRTRLGERVCCGAISAQSRRSTRVAILVCCASRCDDTSARPVREKRVCGVAWWTKQRGGGRDIVMVVEPTRCSETKGCLLYTSPSPRDKRQSRMPSSA